MPMNWKLYPLNWRLIAKEVKTRAGWCCEDCYANHGEIIHRMIANQGAWVTDTEYRILPDQERVKYGRGVKVVLTVHHVGIVRSDGSAGDPNDKMDNRPENLRALCQRCHLVADTETHIRNRRRNKTAALVAAGQGELL